MRWADLEFDAGQAAIRQTVIAVGHQVQMGTPKTARSRRTVAIDEGTVNVLRARQARQAAERLQIGAGCRDHDLVFCIRLLEELAELQDRLDALREALRRLIDEF